MNAITYETGNLENLRKQLGEWARKNFGDTLPSERTKEYGMLRCLAGMSEELSEFIKETDMTQTRPSTDQILALDAIADICVYALDFMYTAELTIQDVLLHDRDPSGWEKKFISAMASMDAGPEVAVNAAHIGLAYCIGQLNHAVLKMCQDIRRDEPHWDHIRSHMCHVWRLCYRLANYYGKNLNPLMHETVGKVTQRDWQKDRDHAHERVDEDEGVRN